jgi:Domain of unknown function (DUF4386)
MSVFTTPKPTFVEDDQSARLQRTARLAGLAYLGLLICGLLGNQLIRGEIYVSDTATETAANLVKRNGLARLGIAVDLGIVLTQALVAWMFYALFRHVHAIAAAAIAAFGLLSAAVQLIAVAFSATALNVALDRDVTSADDAQLLYGLQDAAWQVGGLFFGLWLLPMGWLVLQSRYMPRLLGGLLIAGGVGYVLNPFATYLLPDATAAADVLLVPSTIAELWMIGYLLVKGVAPRGQLPATSTS